MFIFALLTYHSITHMKQFKIVYFVTNACTTWFVHFAFLVQIKKFIIVGPTVKQAVCKKIRKQV